MKKTIFRAFSVLSITALSAIAAGAAAFLILIVCGLSPKLQTIWICSAMRTMSHKYLATMFFSDDYITSVMEANEIDDSGYDSEILSFRDSGKDKADAGDDAETGNSSGEEKEINADETEAHETEAETEEASEAEETEDLLNSGVFITDGREKAQDAAPEPESSGDAYIDEGYELLEDGIYLKEVSGLTWRGYVMLISDPLRVKLVDTSMQFSCGENVMTMTTNSGAVAGINGGGFQDGVNYDSNGGMPSGLLIEDGKVVYPFTIDETVYNLIGINDEGALVLRHCTAAWAIENNIVSAVSFAPFIVVNGEGLIKEGSGGWGIAPRTAIGQRETGEMLLLVIDGRQADWSIGCDIDVLQEVMLAENAYNAAMLDGGSSTAMVYNGDYINRPSLGHERWINNAFVVMPKN